MTRTDTSVPAARPRRRRLSRSISLAVALGATIAGSNLVAKEASAGVPPALQPTKNRPMQFLFGFGPSFGIGGSRWIYGDCGPGNSCNYYRYGFGGRYGGAFKLSQEFNFHFSGNASGPALGVILNEEFSGPYVGFNIAPKFTYDIQPMKNLALYISPSVSFGYHLDHYAAYYWGAGYGYGYNYHAANLQFGVALKLIIKDRFIAFLQAPNFDFIIGPGNYWRNGYYGGGCPPGYGCGAYFRAKVDVMFGVGVAF